MVCLDFDLIVVFMHALSHRYASEFAAHIQTCAHGFITDHTTSFFFPPFFFTNSLYTKATLFNVLVQDHVMFGFKVKMLGSLRFVTSCFIVTDIPIALSHTKQKTTNWYYVTSCDKSDRNNNILWRKALHLHVIPIVKDNVNSRLLNGLKAS